MTPDLFAAVEPLAAAAARNPEMTVEETSVLSIAISLKRIADAAEAMGGGGQSGLENLAWHLGHSLGAGFEHGRKA